MEGGEAVRITISTLNVREEAAGLVGAVEYCRDLFTRESIENLLAQYTGLLEQIAANARLPIDEYAVVTPWDERIYREARGRVGGRGGIGAYGTVIKGISEQGTLTERGRRLVAWEGWAPTQIVVSDEDGEHSAQEVMRQADGLAQELVASGVQPGNASALSRAWVGARWWRGWRFSSWVGLRTSCPRAWGRGGGAICVSRRGLFGSWTPPRLVRRAAI